MEKPNYEQYTPVTEDESTRNSEQDGLLHPDYPGSLKWPTKLPLKSRLMYGIGALLLAIVYSVAIVAATSWWWKKERLHGAAVVECK